jgi:outer membrane murein-binding lipoprotein Lpp
MLLLAGAMQTLQDGLNAGRAQMDTLASNADVRVLESKFEKLSTSHRCAQQGIDSAQTQLNSFLQEITASKAEASSQGKASAECLASLEADLNSRM